MTTAFVLTISAQSLEVQLQRAEQREVATGDFKAAITEYKRIADAAGADRAVDARARLRMAEAYQKLGAAEARAIYQQLVQDYGDQPTVVSSARAHLGEFNNPGIVNRRVWSAPVETGIRLGRVSPDGRSVAYTTANDLMIRDLASGREQSVIRFASGRPGPTLAWSPDARRIAFEITLSGTEIRTINVDGSDMQTLLSPGAPWARVLDYFPDGDRLLLAMAQGGDSLVFTMRVADKRPQPLVLRPGPGGSGWPRLSPDGRYVALRNAPGLSLLATDGTGETVITRNESDLNAAGWSSDGSRLLFVRRQDGRIDLWSMPVGDGRSSGPSTLVYRDYGSAGVIENHVDRDGSLYYVKSGLGTTELYVMERILSQGR
jgi:Tol biopolymer transport system component